MGGPVSTLKYYTLQDIANLVGKTRQTVHRWTFNGKLPAPDAVAGVNDIWLVTAIDAWVAAGGDKT